MAKCDHCGTETEIPYECLFCSGMFCENHRLPENHNCKHARVQAAGIFYYMLNKNENGETDDAYRRVESDREVARRIAYVHDRKSAWRCPACKALNLNEERVCHQCKRLKPDSLTT